MQNNDPEHRGRVKVYVPHVNAGVYEKWYGVKKNKSYKFVGKNIDSDLSDILVDLKTILPWAEQASPIGSQSATGRYNAFTANASVSDTNNLSDFAPDTTYTQGDNSLNASGVGEKPARKYEIEHTRLSDAFADADHDSPSGVKRPNKYSYNYKPSSYSNCAKGVFGVPNVGAHVWMFFQDGDPQDPVYFAAALGEQDWQSVFTNNSGNSPDYPGAYENEALGDQESRNINVETYRNKFLINQKGGTLEFVNTDNREILKMTHYSGSFKEFNNHATIELASTNDQKLVLQDQYLTVNGYGGVYYGRDLDYIVQGDHFLRVGKQDDALHRAWREKARELHHIKQLFETQRADTSADSLVLPGAFVSPYQALSGSNTALCPVCTTTSPRADIYHDLNEDWGNVGVPVTKHDGSNVYNQPSVAINTNTVVYTSLPGSSQLSNPAGQNIFGESCPACGGSGTIQGSMDGTYYPEPRKQANTWLQEARRIIDQLADIESGLGRGGNEIHNIAKHKIETVGMVMNDFGSVRIDTQGKYFKNEVKILDQGVVNNRVTSPVIEYVHVDDLPGGSYTLNVCNRWNVQVGAGGVSMKSYGPVDIGGTITNIGGTQVNIGSENEVNIDGGRRLNMVSDILTLRQRDRGQVLVDSNLGVTQNVVIGGGMHVEGEVSLHHVSAPVEIQETQKTELWGKSEWDETLIIGYIACNSVHPPSPDPENGVPAPPPYYSQWIPVYSRVAPTDSVIGIDVMPHDPEKWEAGNEQADHNCLRTYPHSHHFKNLPLHLYDTNQGVREVGKNCESVDPHAASGRQWLAATDKVIRATSPNQDDT